MVLLDILVWLNQRWGLTISNWLYSGVEVVEQEGEIRQRLITSCCNKVIFHHYCNLITFDISLVGLIQCFVTNCGVEMAEQCLK